jgi:hypothetical protein
MRLSTGRLLSRVSLIRSALVAGLLPMLGACVPQRVFNWNNPSDHAVIVAMVRQGLVRAIHDCDKQIPLPRPGAGDAEVAVRRGEVPMLTRGQSSVVRATLNQDIQLEFVVDTGASTSTLPPNVVHALGCNGSVTEGDFLGAQISHTAGGHADLTPVVRITEIDIPGYTLRGIPVVVTNGPALLGRNLIQSVDLTRNVFVPRVPAQCAAPRAVWDPSKGGCDALPAEAPVKGN